MRLADLQARFMADLVSDDDAVIGTDADEQGIAIYRNAYRTSLVGALQETFARTRSYCGEENFDRAARHHLISTPPSSWSLDHAGKGFAETLADLFTEDPEVAELAALEWAMHCVFVGADETVATLETFSADTQHLTSEDWFDLRLCLIGAMAVIPCSFDLVSLWNEPDISAARLDNPGFAMVWREEERPVFVLIDTLEMRALELMRGGGTFGSVCELATRDTGEAEAASTAARLLRSWLSCGIVAKG